MQAGIATRVHDSQGAVRHCIPGEKMEILQNTYYLMLKMRCWKSNKYCTFVWGASDTVPINRWPSLPTHVCTVRTVPDIAVKRKRGFQYCQSHCTSYSI